MRLIDADKLILHLNDYALQKSPSDVESSGDRKVSRAVYKAITDCIRAVDEQPTAFDLDKVVEQLEDMKSTYRRLRDLKDKDYLKYGYIIETLIDAIEIVKDDGGDEMIEKSMPATKNVPKERDTMSCKKAERYGYVKAICETDKGLFNRKVEEWINLTDGVILDASCGIIDGKTVFQAVIGGLRK